MSFGAAGQQLRKTKPKTPKCHAFAYAKYVAGQVALPVKARHVRACQSERNVKCRPNVLSSSQ